MPFQAVSVFCPKEKPSRLWLNRFQCRSRLFRYFAPQPLLFVYGWHDRFNAVLGCFGILPLPLNQLRDATRLWDVSMPFQAVSVFCHTKYPHLKEIREYGFNAVLGCFGILPIGQFLMANANAQFQCRSRLFRYFALTPLGEGGHFFIQVSMPFQAVSVFCRTWL